MKIIDVPLPLDAQLPTHPHDSPLTPGPIERTARRAGSIVSTLHMSAHTATDVDAPLHLSEEGSSRVPGRS